MQVLRCAAGMFDVGIVRRWNIAAGIPDKCAPLQGYLAHSLIYRATSPIRKCPPPRTPLGP